MSYLNSIFFTYIMDRHPLEDLLNISSTIDLALPYLTIDRKIIETISNNVNLAIWNNEQKINSITRTSIKISSILFMCDLQSMSYYDTNETNMNSVLEKIKFPYDKKVIQRCIKNIIEESTDLEHFLYPKYCFIIEISNMTCYQLPLFTSNTTKIYKKSDLTTFYDDNSMITNIYKKIQLIELATSVCKNTYIISNIRRNLTALYETCFNYAKYDKIDV